MLRFFGQYLDISIQLEHQQNQIHEACEQLSRNYDTISSIECFDCHLVFLADKKLCNTLGNWEFEEQDEINRCFQCVERKLSKEEILLKQRALAQKTFSTIRELSNGTIFSAECKFCKVYFIAG
jgi:hypothetical protein